MTENQELNTITIDQLTATTKDLFDKGYRLVQIGCTKTESGLELNYSFDKALQFSNYKLHLLNTDTPIPSMSTIYPNAFLYENEIHDLYGIQIEGITIDFKGHFYQLSESTPFNQKSPSEKEVLQ